MKYTKDPDIDKLMVKKKQLELQLDEITKILRKKVEVKIGKVQ